MIANMTNMITTTIVIITPINASLEILQHTFSLDDPPVRSHYEIFAFILDSEFEQQSHGISSLLYTLNERS